MYVVWVGYTVSKSKLDTWTKLSQLFCMAMPNNGSCKLNNALEVCAVNVID